jgi:hypothetical protein
MTTLETVSGIKARIFKITDRPPFIVSADLAEAYGTSVKAINQAVKRNSARFPNDFTFRLGEADLMHLRSQSVTANSISTKVRFDPVVFTHAGALMLSAVLKTPVAAEVSVIVHRAFAAMEEQAIRDAQDMVLKLRIDMLRKKPIYAYVEMSLNAGLALDAMWRASNYPKWKLEAAARELRAMQIIQRLPKGMQEYLFDV